MAILYLVRHGQASFGAANYDQLSPLGVVQAGHVGRWLAQVVTSADRLVAGSLVRHQDTANAAIEAWRAAHPSVSLPSLDTDPRLNEYDHVDFLEVAQRELDPASFKLDPGLSRAEFHRMFEIAFARWMDPDHAHQYREPFSEFQSRVLHGLEDLMQGDLPTTVAFSSGGSIATIVQAIMGLDRTRMMAVNTLMANAAVTKLVFSGKRRSVAFLNNYGFLEALDPALVSFR